MNINTIAAEIFSKYPCRFKSDEKNEFISYIRSQLLACGYRESDITVAQQKDIFKTRNIVIGNPSTAKKYITAHYDTPGSNGFLLASSRLLGQTGANIVMMLGMAIAAFALLGGLLFAEDRMFDNGELPLWGVLVVPLILFIVFFGFMFVIMGKKNPSNRNDNTSGVLTALGCAARLRENVQRGEVCVVLFDNEEWGLIGSTQLAAQLKSQHIDLKTRTVINIDCVGVGDIIVAATVGKPAGGTCAFLDALDGALGEKLIREKSSLVYMSDHASFPDSFMLGTMKRSKLGPLYLPNVHTSKDTECDVAMTDRIAAAVTAVINK